MYDTVYDAWKKERENIDLQPLAKDFYVVLAGYVKKIREESRMLDEKTAKARLIKCELQNVRRLAKALVQLRLEKIFQATTQGKTISTDVLTDEEEKLCIEMLPLAESFQEFLKGILHGRPLKVDVVKERSKLVPVRFLKDTPAIIGADMKTYGPFKPEDIGTVPIENANVLVKQGLAAKIELE
jgi:DNA replication initiation complex subunit (GINS family)